MNQVAEDTLMHYGIKRRSGRYPWGSGEDPYQHGRDFLGRVEELKKQGWTETAENIKKEFGLTTKEYRNEKTIAKDQRRMLDVARIKSLQSDGLNPTEIGKIMGKNESSIRSLLNAEAESRMLKTQSTVDFLKKQVDEKKMVDVGTGIERELNVSKERLDLALYYLETREGYPVYKGGIPQATNPGQQTNQRVLCVPGTQHKEIYDYDKVQTLTDYISQDGGDTFRKKFTYPTSMDSSRLKIRYAEDGGINKDGIIELRRGVDDLSLGESRYSQVRILVDGTHYLKGMALYSDDMPDGVDVVFNTNKPKGTPMTKVLKPIKKDPDNPFGSLIKDADQGGQYWYKDKDGKEKLGLINKRSDEGDWTEWKDALPSQFLSKQSRIMAKKQLNLAKADKFEEYDTICSLENPTIKKHLLGKFADECDSAAVHLQAAALPGQKYHVIIPVTSMKDNEVYAPRYENGTKLALIRYPHGGTFEIPILTVNNKQQVAKKLLGTDITDAVAINSKVAERLSGADFDGDTVMCIPTHDKQGKVKIASTPPLKGLEGFDPKISYGADKSTVDPDGTEHLYRAGHEFKRLKATGLEMGKISNLITDMTLAGATDAEKAKAVRHSMVVIDAEKHGLDWKQSEIDNDIAYLKKKYQDGGGASTIISKAKGQHSVEKRQGSPRINIKGKEWYDPTKPEGSLVYKTADDLYYPERSYNKKTGEMTIRTTDGKKIQYNVADKDAYDKYNPVKRVDPGTGEVTYTDKSGKIPYRVRTRTQYSSNMAETDDAYTLVSKAKHPMEVIYADYANSMKALANRARMEMVKTGKIEFNKGAKEKYKTEVYSLDKKLNEALLNATRERAAQRMAAATVKSKQIDDPDMKPGDVKKAGQQALTKYRSELGSVSRRKRNIDITDREWEAIQKGAISESTLNKILNNTDIDKLREKAMPKTTKELSKAKINRIKAMSSSNYSLSEIADKLGISPSTVSKYLKGEN